MRKRSYLSRFFTSALIAVSLNYGMGAAAASNSRDTRIGVLTPGRTFNPVFAGLKAGLDRFGYREEKNVTARVIGLKIPRNVLNKIDRVVE